MKDILQRIHARVGDLWWYTALLFVAQRFGDAINMFVGMWLVPRYVPQEENQAIGIRLVLALAAAFLGSLGLAAFTMHEQDLLHGTFLLGCSLICAALSILLLLASIGLTKAVCRGTAACVRKCKKRIVGKGSAA